MIDGGPEKRSFLMMGNYYLALVHQQMQQWQATIAACDQALLHGGTQLLPLAKRVEQLREQVLEHLASASILQG